MADHHPTRRRLILGFNFYGAGNIGDDLMLAGFLRAMDELGLGESNNLISTTPWDIGSQRLRFPRIAWLPPEEFQRCHSATDPSGSRWAGVGDTPFQLTCGPWFLDYLTHLQDAFGGFASRALVNVGAETEIEPRAGDFARIARSFDRISTRDAQSTRVLLETLGVDANRLTTGADLANMALGELMSGPYPRPVFQLGLILGADTLSPADLDGVGRFLIAQPEPVAFLANEVRIGPGFERSVLRALTDRHGPALREKTVLLVPPYADGTLRDLLAPIRLCRTLLSSRYHGLLAGAWAGARIGAIGRSSKVTALAAELGIPCCVPPITPDTLEGLAREATTVSPATLQSLRDDALRGVAFALGS